MRLPNYTNVIRLGGPPPDDPTGTSARLMALLRDGVPLTLLMDLADPAGPNSRGILLAELVTDDVRRDRTALLDAATDFAADQDVC